MSVTESSIVGPKGRVVVPQRFREQLGINEGDELLFAVGPHGGLTMVSRQRLVDSLAGSWADGVAESAAGSLIDELFEARRAEAEADGK